MSWLDFFYKMFSSSDDSSEEARAKAILHERFSNDISSEELQYIYNYWKLVRIDTDNCDVLDEDATFDLQRIKEEHIDFFSRRGVLNYEKLNLVRLSCYDKTVSPAKAYRTTLTDCDATAVRAKINVQGYINVFIDPEAPANYYIDTSFLHLELSVLMERG